jgi:multiple sugar transport system ATP-binding protein
MAAIELERLTKVYADGTRAVHELDLEIADGEFVVFVGPSGCGKTSALRMIAGLEDITSGTVRVGDEVVNDLPPKARDVAMVFQRQRVAMGRAIVREPQAFLMDEPLSNLDAKLRVQMRAEIARIQRDLRVTTIYVTHDQSEAMTLGDRVCVLRGGLLQQVDRPQVLYDLPANLFVAGFIGSPAMNLVEAELGDGSVRFGPHELPIPEAVLSARPQLQAYAGGRIALGIRPEDIRAAGGGAPLDITVDIKEDMGAEVYIHFAVDAPALKSDDLREILGPEALDAAEEQTHHHGSPFIARVERGTAAREGEKARLLVDTTRLHFFDLESGAGIYADTGDRARDPAAA